MIYYYRKVKDTSPDREVLKMFTVTDARKNVQEFLKTEKKNDEAKVLECIRTVIEPRIKKMSATGATETSYVLFDLDESTFLEVAGYVRNVGRFDIYIDPIQKILKVFW